MAWTSRWPHPRRRSDFLIDGNRDPAPPLGEQSDRNPGGERREQPDLCRRRAAKRCCASHRNSFAPARQPATPIRPSASRLNRAPKPAPVTLGLHRLDRVAAGEKRRDVLRPVRQALERHRHAADDQHRQEDALAERLHRRNVVGQRRDHQAEADEREGHAGEGDPTARTDARGAVMPISSASASCSSPPSDMQQIARDHRARDDAQVGTGVSR